MKDESSRGLLDRVRGLRDSAMEDLAKVTLTWTSSSTYQSLNAVIARPMLLTTGLFRRATEAAMADVLARFNLPSREDVLALSQRLTRIEMTLDDLGAGMDHLRRTETAQQRPGPREREGNGERRPAARPAVKGG